MFEMYFKTNLYYLDPGTGGFLLQALIAAGITAGIYFRNIKLLIINFLKKIKKKQF